MEHNFPFRLGSTEISFVFCLFVCFLCGKHSKSHLNQQEKTELVSYTFLLSFILSLCYLLPKIIV